ncbi:MAG TPA: hypothetical protein VJP85_05675 [Candidatus Baltobacteraceae bacterium]|nr:hypothetical protein [Candidatus Baltobacteraceae bacterium]
MAEITVTYPTLEMAVGGFVGTLAEVVARVAPRMADVLDTRISAIAAELRKPLME